MDSDWQTRVKHEKYRSIMLMGGVIVFESMRIRFKRSLPVLAHVCEKESYLASIISIHEDNTVHLRMTKCE